MSFFLWKNSESMSFIVRVKDKRINSKGEIPEKCKLKFALHIKQDMILWDGLSCTDILWWCSASNKPNQTKLPTGSSQKLN